MLLLWMTILLPPILALAQQLLGFILVPWACATGLQPYIWMATVIFMIATLGLSFAAWRIWRENGSEFPDEQGTAVARTRFLAIGGVALGLMSTLVILAQGIPTFILHPCN